jgi:hypothetical protein
LAEVGVRDACSICSKEGRVAEAVVTNHVEYALLPERWLTHDGLLMQDEALHACAEHVSDVANIMKLDIDSATRRFSRAMKER